MALRRVSAISCVVALMGCDITPFRGGVDGFMLDLTSLSPPDFPGGQPFPDIGTPPHFAPTGSACTSNDDCASSLGGTNKAPWCIAFYNNARWTNGYCTSGCRPSLTDQATGLNPDCPGDPNGAGATCEALSQMSGQCRAFCQDAQMDCRAQDGYWCKNVDYGGACVARDVTWCDPTMNACPKAMDGNEQLCWSLRRITAAASAPSCVTCSCSSVCIPRME
jgi:hypothetical protein